MSLIQAQELVHRYGDYVAVDHIDFTIKQGECFGFLGPNGAGKTTTMRMLYCLSPVHGGALRVLDMDVMEQPREIKARLGVVPQEDNLDPDLTVLQNLLLYGRFFGLPRSQAMKRAQELLGFMGLAEKKDARLRQLSGGMRRRLLIARSLIHGPEILILDEPTTGLDPQARYLIWQQLTRLKDEGVTLVLTTHYMEEAAKLCDRLVIMDHARILVEGAPASLVQETVGHEVIEVRSSNGKLEPLSHQVRDGGGDVEHVGDHTFFFFKEMGQAEPLLAQLAGEFYVHRPATLEDVFMKLTGRELRE